MMASISTLSRSSSEKLRRAAAALDGMKRSLYVTGERGLLQAQQQVAVSSVTGSRSGSARLQGLPLQRRC